MPKRPGKETIRPTEENVLDDANEGHDQGYYEDGCYDDEVATLRQQLEEALCTNQELTYQVQEAQRNPPGKSKKKVSKKVSPTETETTTVQEEPRPRNGLVTC